jgi:hypothetical protein
MTSRDPHNVVRLAVAPNPMMAHIWEQALRTEGIECKVVGDYLDASFGDISGLRPELWVHQEDVAAAQEVLRRGPDAAEGPGADEPAG